MNHIPVPSSMIQSAAFENDVIEIAFKSGTRYQYGPFTREVFDAFLTADSPGQFFNRHIKGHRADLPAVPETAA